jgi:hypothetical protein
MNVTPDHKEGERAEGSLVKTMFQKAAFAALATTWAVLWVPLTIMFVTVYVPAKAVPCMVRRGENKRAVAAALWAAWPIWMVAIVSD